MATDTGRTGRDDVAQNARSEKENRPTQASGRSQTVRDVMTPEPDTVGPQDNLQQVAVLMLKCDCGSIPVVENDKVVGIITDRDIVVRVIAKGKNPLNTRVSEAMSDNIHTVRENDSLDRVMSIMSEHQIRRVPVVDDQDRLVGIVAQADLATEAKDNRKVEKTIENISEKSGSEDRPRR
jgi:CBS domain-containing protein